MTNVQAAVLRSRDGAYTIEDLTLDAPGPGQVVVRIVAAGYCHTDVLVRNEAFGIQVPVVPGHEGAGVVESFGADVDDLKVGDHVVITFATCGTCGQCSSGHPAYCDTYMERQLYGRSANGGAGAIDAGGQPVNARWFGQSSFATKSIVDRNSLVKVDTELDLSILAPLGCGIITGAGSVMNVLNVEAGSSIAIFGTGAVGLAALMAAKAVGATEIIGVDIHPARLELARELGATATINGADKDVVDQIRKLSDGGTNYSFDTTGIPEVSLNAIRVLRNRGICGLVGVQTGDMVLDPATLPGKQVVSIVDGDAEPQSFIPKLIELWRSGEFPLNRLVQTYPLTEINRAEDDSLSGRTIKPVLTMSE